MSPDDPTAADVAGQLTIISAEITPGPIIEPFALVSQQLRNILQGQLPGLTNSNPRPLMRIGPQTVNFRAVNRRVYHDRIEFMLGSTIVRTRGSVGLLDESLIMEAEVPVASGNQPGAQADVVHIPIGGTLKSPKLDFRAIEQLAAKRLKNAVGNALRTPVDELQELIRPKQ